MTSPPPLDFRHSPGSFRLHPHTAFVFMRGPGGHRRCGLLCPAQEAAPCESYKQIQNPE
jgi:hypothetical protein